MDLIETIFSRGVATIIMLPLLIIILIFYNKVFWFVGGLFKIKDPFWKGWEDFWKGLIIETERKLYLIKEQELCQKFQKLNSTNKTNSISTFLSISQS